jgi:DNA-directed RNA polymerase subunit RPC12/RpoP
MSSYFDSPSTEEELAASFYGSTTTVSDFSTDFATPLDCGTTSIPAFEKTNPYPNASAVLYVRQGSAWHERPNYMTYVGNCKICRMPAEDFPKLQQCYYSHFEKYDCFYEQCRKTFPTMEAAHQHYITEHDSIKEPATIRCNVCGEVVSTREHLDEHTHRHTKELNNIYIFFNCDRCNYQYITSSNFIEHMSKHRDITIRNVEFDKFIPTLALPEDIVQLRRDQAKLSTSSSMLMSTSTSMSSTSTSVGAGGGIRSLSDLLPIKIKKEEEENYTAAPDVFEVTSSEDTRKKEQRVYLCVVCGKIMARPKPALKHENGTDPKCPNMPGKTKVKKFADQRIAKIYHQRLNEVKGDHHKWNKIVAEIETLVDLVSPDGEEKRPV